MRKISANYIFPVNSSPVKNGIVTLNDDNVIIQIEENPEQKEYSGVEFYNGILVPGFVNCHLHLELSYLKNTISKHKGITEFIKEINAGKTLHNDIKAINIADFELQKNGIVAAGDIINNNCHTDIKKNSNVYYHNFIEMVGYKDFDELYKHVNDLTITLKNNKLPYSVTPHSFYSLTKNTLQTVFSNASNDNSILSVHNQESKEEAELFNNKSGKLYEFLNLLTKNHTLWNSGNTHHFEFLADVLEPFSHLLLIHNTYTTRSDIELIKKHVNNLFWVICPTSNLFIENKLPDINIFLENNQIVALGTDSLASNDSLDILKEIKVILNHFPNISFEEALSWATINGAKALRIQDKFGTLEKGKKPGINLINNFDFTNFKPSSESRINVII